MANFAICVDADRERRTRFIQAVLTRLPLFRDLITGSCSAQDLDAAWSAGAHAPVAFISGEEGTAVAFGEVIDPQGHRLAVSTIRNLWSVKALEQAPADFDGYYAACVYLPNARLIAGADLLGLFPVYYYTSGDVFLMGSSPETFRHHPSFRVAFNPSGLVGILLTNSLFDGETLYPGVRRLAAGHLLVWEPGTPAKEVPYYRVPLSNRYADLSFSSHLDIIDDAMKAATVRYAPPGRPYSLLLSGGLDSRTVGGYLRREGRDAIALTFGTPGDIEVQCATPVARALGVRHYVRELDVNRYPDYARLQASWEHGASGFSLIMQWGMRDLLLDLPPASVTGLGLDWVLGGHSPTDPRLSFDSFFEYQNAWGLAPSLLEKLLRHDIFTDTVSATMSRIRATYTKYADTESRRAWSFSLYHRLRFHIGSEAWRLSFAAWPVIPATDKALIDIGGALPPATVADRRAQMELLCTRFPELAALPLDRNSYDTTPLRPRLRWLLAQRLNRSTRWLQRTLVIPGRHGRPERRRYYRMFDINGPGWVAVRREAEPYRELAYRFFEKKAFDELLPPPHVAIQYRDGITDVAGIKNVIGFMLWAKDHLG